MFCLLRRCTYNTVEPCRTLIWRVVEGNPFQDHPFLHHHAAFESDEDETASLSTENAKCHLDLGKLTLHLLMVQRIEIKFEPILYPIGFAQKDRPNLHDILPLSIVVEEGGFKMIQSSGGQNGLMALRNGEKKRIIDDAAKMMS